MPDQALTGMRVLDLSHHIAGPYCTKLLADLGADVIKIEKPGEGDAARRIGPFLNDQPDPETSALFLHLNTNKRGITLNLKTETGKKIFKDLVKTADIVVENFSPRVMPSLGLDYASLEKINPKIILTSISNFGQTGPYRDFKAEEIVEYALGGLMYFVGEGDREPTHGAGSQAQYAAALYACVATLGAHHYQRLTGIGQQVDVSIQDSVTSMLENVTTTYIYTGRMRPRIGSRREGSHPFSMHECKDGWVTIVGGGANFWKPLCELTENAELLQDARFNDGAFKAENWQLVNAKLHPWLMQHTQEEIFELGQLWRIPVGKVPNIDGVLELEQLKARDFFVELEHPRAGKFKYPGAPYKLPVTPWELRRPAPLLGQHDEEIICGELGYSKEELLAMHQQGIV